MKQTSAKENIAACPDYCYSVNLVDGKLIKIVAGESGFYSIDNVEIGFFHSKFHGLNNDQLADALNELKDITNLQREAMENGSMFGWEVPGANPYYLLNQMKKHGEV